MYVWWHLKFNVLKKKFLPKIYIRRRWTESVWRLDQCGGAVSSKVPGDLRANLAINRFHRKPGRNCLFIRPPASTMTIIIVYTIRYTHNIIVIECTDYADARFALTFTLFTRTAAATAQVLSPGHLSTRYNTLCIMVLRITRNILWDICLYFILIVIVSYILFYTQMIINITRNAARKPVPVDGRVLGRRRVITPTMCPYGMEPTCACVRFMLSLECVGVWITNKYIAQALYTVTLLIHTRWLSARQRWRTTAVTFCTPTVGGYSFFFQRRRRAPIFTRWTVRGVRVSKCR